MELNATVTDVRNLWYHPVSQNIRHLFYFVTPNETSFKTVKDVPNYVDDVIPYFILFIILEAITSHITGKRKFRINDGISSMSAGVISQLPTLFFSFELATYVYVYENYRLTTLEWNSALVWIFTMLAYDFGYYWVHRCGHEVNILWAAHQAHHSSEDYNLTTALRQSAFQRYGSWMFYLPIALLGVPPSIQVVHASFNLLYQFWIHTEVVRTLGPLEYILNTPSHHRVHHGRNRYCIDKNYGGTLIIWDFLFGTQEWEKDEVVYGLVHPLESFDPFYIQLCHYKWIWSQFWKAEGFGNKLSVIFKGPGWEPGKPRLGLSDDIPEISAPQPYFDIKLPTWSKLYLFTHFILINLWNLLLIQEKKHQPALMILAGAAFILFSLTIFGWLAEKRPSAPIFESFRCVVFVIIDFILLKAAIFSFDNQLFILINNIFVAIHILSALIWFCARNSNAKTVKVD